MTGKVAIVSGASQGIGAGLVAGYRSRGWAVVASARTITPSEDPYVLTVEGDIADSDRRPHHRPSARTVRPHRHPGQ
jgi:NAD(P)-dependent dehydrogenase (short-subunit alcohol dehydrogenase family)